jgi:hypothetical protein
LANLERVIAMVADVHAYGVRPEAYGGGPPVKKSR